MKTLAVPQKIQIVAGTYYFAIAKNVLRVAEATDPEKTAYNIDIDNSSCITYVPNGSGRYKMIKAKSGSYRMIIPKPLTKAIATPKKMIIVEYEIDPQTLTLGRIRVCNIKKWLSDS